MYTVLNQVSGKSFQCGSDEIVLDGALTNGFNFPYGCQNGFCGQCKAVILNGEIDYDGPTPEAISDEDQDANIALLCQCKAKTDLYIAVDELDSLANIQIRSMPCRVEQVNHLNHDVVQLILKIPGSQSLQYLAVNTLTLSTLTLSLELFQLLMLRSIQIYWSFTCVWLKEDSSQTLYSIL